MLSVLDISYSDEFDLQYESTETLKCLKTSVELDSESLVQKYDQFYCFIFLFCISFTYNE